MGDNHAIGISRSCSRIVVEVKSQMMCWNLSFLNTGWNISPSSLSRKLMLSTYAMWVESQLFACCKSYLIIKNEDIDTRSLHFVFGALYTDADLSITPLEVPQVLAAACLLRVMNIRTCCQLLQTVSFSLATARNVAGSGYGFWLWL